MRTFSFIIPGEPMSRKSRNEQIGFMAALEEQQDSYGVRGVVGLGFVWTSNRKLRNKILLPTRRHLVYALLKSGLLNRNAFPYNVYNLEQRIKPAYGAPCEGRITLIEESE
jgi:hypothetical protein